MAGKYDRDELFIALKRHGETEEGAVNLLDDLDKRGVRDFTMKSLVADELQRQFHGRHGKYQISLSRKDHAGGWVVVHAVSLCVKRGAPWVNCCVCDTPVKTCERKEPIGGDYRCPVHNQSSQLRNGRWVCSPDCWEIATAQDSITA